MIGTQDDWLIEAIEEVVGAAQATTEAIAAVVAACEATRGQRLAGASEAEIFHYLRGTGARQKRLAASAAMDNFEHAVLLYRAGVVRAMIDDEGLSFSELARLMKVSRQMVARLYRTGVDGAAGSTPTAM